MNRRWPGQAPGDLESGELARHRIGRQQVTVWDQKPGTGDHPLSRAPLCGALQIGLLEAAKTGQLQQIWLFRIYGILAIAP